MPEAAHSAAAGPLLDGLSRYSEQGADYVAVLRRLIETESLERFAGARLAEAERLAPATAGPFAESGFLLLP